MTEVTAQRHGQPEAAGVISVFNDGLETFRVPPDRYPRPRDLAQLAKLLEAMAWNVDYVGVSPLLDAEERAVLVRHDVIPQDLNDLTLNLE